MTLLQNALKFTRKGIVTVSLEYMQTNPAYVQIIIKDTGCGIPEDKI